MQGMRLATGAVFGQFQSARVVASVFLRCIVALLALGASQRDNHAYCLFRHFLTFAFVSRGSRCPDSEAILQFW
jgi:hypothetical protein